MLIYLENFLIQCQKHDYFDSKIIIIINFLLHYIKKKSMYKNKTKTKHKDNQRIKIYRQQ